MSKDAKLGLVLGIGLVIIITVVFFRKDPAHAKAATDNTAAAVKPKGTLTPTTRQHTVAEGDTLSSLALRYYSDGSKFVRIYQANEDLLRSPERLEPGMVLMIPD